MADYGGLYGDGGFNQDIGNSEYGGENNGSQKQQLRSSLTPVTIKQITEATQPIPDGEFQVNNVDLNLVSFVGVVRNVNDITSAVLITIEDGTGSIEVRRWIDESTNASESEAQKYELNKYVYVTGALKEFNGKKNLQHATIRGITDHNEVVYHHLNAIAHHLKSQGLSTRPGTSGGDNGLFVKDSNGMDLPGSLQDRIFSVIRDNTSSMQEGVPVPFISSKLNTTDDVVMELCSELINEGKIYSGYDDSAYLAV
ncbi:Piso0_003600 [Millerozyma farinosa CBS 7064]|uniref:Piso0_003600 protein n=1 Tax=Pichia sorbitophila (strain ATCC MYA-4447 / BCRC 22081 / CBS 7064 / NBRC 10061 / NRRL Y-12695) TaxID=559304 RepID=G8YJI8_PICSO|nr:Piso0_003600 [Millerozyma farinosa CBS 7064]CCE81248.1 Piso0_003600 [Millerozyma farinosa CBS 7064]